MREVFDSFDAIVRQSKRQDDKKKPKPTPPYLEEFYNIQGFYQQSSQVSDYATGRIYNSVIDSLNANDRLPRFLVVVIDKDILHDIETLDYGVAEAIAFLTNWLTRKIDIAVRRNRFQIEAKKPGAIGCHSDPVIIYVDMIYRPEQKGRTK